MNAATGALATRTPNEAPAVALVLGMSVPGLAITRALARAGIEVYAVNHDRSGPGTATRYAKILYAEGINSDRCAAILLELRAQLPPNRPIVVYPSSDNMVRSISVNWPALAPYFRVSWADSIEMVNHLLDKAHLEALCTARGIDYPRSTLLEDPSDAADAVERVGLPLLVKPTRPLSGFKALQVNSVEELEALVARYPDNLPFLVQRWIAGGDDTLYFCSMILAQGRPLGVFTGRKLEASPPGTGVGTVVESRDAPEVRALSERFIEGLDLSGPIAIEFKRDPQGRYWLIEPNVGRTEYSVDLIIQHGINFPLLEYYSALGQPRPASAGGRREVVWFDSDRDPYCYARFCLREGALRPRGKTPVFPYFGHDDPKPLLHASRRLALRVANAAASRLLRGARQVDIHRYAGFAQLPVEAQDLVAEFGARSPFFTPAWYRNFEREVARHEGELGWYTLANRQGQLYGVWPLVRTRERKRTLLRAMGNYYTPYASLPFRYDSPGAATVFAAAIRWLLRGTDKLEVGPVAPDDPLMTQLDVGGRFCAASEPATVNWFQPIAALDDYFASLPGALRATIARKQRQLASGHTLAVRIHDTDVGLEQALSDYFAIYAASWKKPEPYPEFIRGLARTAAAEGWLRLGILAIDGQPAAAHLWLVRDGTAHIYKLAYDQQLARYSPGSLLTWHMMRHVVEHDGVRRFDYLTGDDAYKRDWMRSARPLHAVTFANPLRPYGALFLLRQFWQRRMGTVGAD